MRDAYTLTPSIWLSGLAKYMYSKMHPRFLLLWQCAGHIRDNSILRRDRHRLSRQHITHILRADRIERTGLRCKDIGIVALSDAKRLKTIGIPCSDQLSRAHDHKGIRSLDLATGASHRFLHRAGFQTLPLRYGRQ